MAKEYIMSIDFGTTGTKAVIYQPDGTEVGQAYLATSMGYPRPGWVSQDAQEIVDKTLQAVKMAIEKTGVKNDEIVAIGVTNVCTTCVPVDKDGNFVYSILSWQDMRGGKCSPTCARFGKSTVTTTRACFEERHPGSLPTLSKVLWFREHEPELWAKTDSSCMSAMLNHADRRPLLRRQA